MNGEVDFTRSCDGAATSGFHAEQSTEHSAHSGLSDLEPAVARAMVAPVLRIEELKDAEDAGGFVVGNGGASTESSMNGTDDEALSGEASDQDGAGQGPHGGPGEEDSSPTIGDFQTPPDDLKNRIIAQVEHKAWIFWGRAKERK